ncbi:MAG: sugar phosphate nucleotidyltransferase [Nanoarchaeota archaeon]
MPKEKVSVSIDQELLKKLQRQIKNERFRSLSEAFETYLQLGLLKSGIRTAVMLIRKRDFPVLFTHIAGKPLIEQHMEFLRKNRIDMLYFITGFSDQVAKLSQYADSAGIKISFLYEEGEEGNVQALKKVEKKIDEPFLLIYGDTYFSFDISKMVERHLSSDALVTVGLYGDQPQKTASVIILDGDDIKSYKKEEKKDSLIIDVGLYLIRHDIFALIESNDRMLERDVFPKICSQGRMKGYFIYGEHTHLGPEE